MREHQQTINQLLHQFKTNLKGLSMREATLRLDNYGLNVLKKVRGKPLIFRFFAQFTDLLAIILIIIGLLAFFVGEPRDGIIIFAIVLINAVIGFSQEYKAERVLAAFKKQLPSFSKVIRNGSMVKIFTWQLVPGDILVLEEGDAVGADARLIEAYDLKTNDFSLTGESEPQAKKAHNISDERVVSDIDNMVFMGTSVSRGAGKAIVVKTGMETEYGKIAKQSQEVKEEMTPLQKELFHTGKVVAVIASGIALFILALFYFMGKDLMTCILFAIAAGAAMVPEGLPAAMSVALSLGAQRMLKKKALVKRLVHVESLGSVTTICTDKTGTLTTGEMTVVARYPREFEKDKLTRHFYRGLAFCNNADISGKEPVGDQVDVSLLKYVASKKDLKDLLKGGKTVFQIPFSSKRKMMTGVVRKNGRHFVYSKGAPQVILEKCELSSERKRHIIAANDDMAKKGLKVLAVAYKKEGKTYEKDDLDDDLHFLALIGLHDPPRKGVSEAISLCRQAQIKVHMITGDYGLTALAIAREIGLSNFETNIITGADLHRLDDEGLKKLLSKETIFARVDPGQKLRIVKNLQEMREVVAVTGDGVNDVPALAKADIGIAMGGIGTDVAKEGADMILLDDNFATIVKAIKEGRRIFDNARKFVFYIFSSNSGELFTPFIGVIMGLPLPLTAVQILAIDLGTDVFPSLGLGAEKAEGNVMDSPPRSREPRIMNFKMLGHLLSVGLIMAAMALPIFIYTLYQGGWRWGVELSLDNPLYFQGTAAVYATLVVCQIANAFSCRSNKQSIFKIGWFSNKWLIYAEIISLIMLWMMMDFAPINEAFHTLNPPLNSWLMIIASFFIFLIIFEFRKKIIRMREEKNNVT